MTSVASNKKIVTTSEELDRVGMGSSSFIKFNEKIPYIITSDKNFNLPCVHHCFRVNQSDNPTVYSVRTKNMNTSSPYVLGRKHMVQSTKQKIAEMRNLYPREQEEYAPYDWLIAVQNGIVTDDEEDDERNERSEGGEGSEVIWYEQFCVGLFHRQTRQTFHMFTIPVPIPFINASDRSKLKLLSPVKVNDYETRPEVQSFLESLMKRWVRLARTYKETTVVGPDDPLKATKNERLRNVDTCVRDRNGFVALWTCGEYTVYDLVGQVLRIAKKRVQTVETNLSPILAKIGSPCRSAMCSISINSVPLRNIPITFSVKGMTTIIETETGFTLTEELKVAPKRISFTNPKGYFAVVDDLSEFQEELKRGGAEIFIDSLRVEVLDIGGDPVDSNEIVVKDFAVETGEFPFFKTDTISTTTKTKKEEGKEEENDSTEGTKGSPLTSPQSEGVNPTNSTAPDSSFALNNKQKQNQYLFGKISILRPLMCKFPIQTEEQRENLSSHFMIQYSVYDEINPAKIVQKKQLLETRKDEVVPSITFSFTGVNMVPYSTITLRNMDDPSKSINFVYGESNLVLQWNLF